MRLRPLLPLSLLAALLGAFFIAPAQAQGLLSSDRLVGRDTAGVGQAEQLTVSSGIAFTGSGGIIVDPSGFTLTGDVDGAGNANDLDEAAVEAELEAVLDVADLQGFAAVALDADIGTTIQAWDTDLDTWRAVVRAAVFDTFTATPSMANLGSLLTNDAAGWTTFGITPTSANLRALLTDEIGTGVLVFLGTPADDQVPVGDSASDTTWRSVPDSDGATQKLQYDTATNSFSAGTDDDVPDAADYSNLTGGTGIVNSPTGTIAFSFTDKGSDVSLGVDECVFTSNATVAGYIVCEGDTANTIETRIAVTDPTTTDKTFTIPDANSNPVQPLTCGGTDKVSAISSAGVITCSADSGGAGSLPGDPNVDAILAWDDVAGASEWWGVGTGLDLNVAGSSVDLDFTELGNLTWAAGSPFTWTFNVGADDPGLTVDASGSGIPFLFDLGGGAGPAFEIFGDSAGANGPGILTLHDSASPATNDVIGFWNAQGKDSGGTITLYTTQRATILDPTDTSEDGQIDWRVITAGTFAEELRLIGSALHPAASGGLDLGTSSLPFGVGYVTTIELGHASDTTLARSAAGEATLEGDEIATLGDANIFTAEQTITLGSGASAEPLSVINTTDSAAVQGLEIEGDRATPTDNDLVFASFMLSDDAGTQVEAARISGRLSDVNVATTVDGNMIFAVNTAGTVSSEALLDGSTLRPFTNDGLALGNTASGFSDFHLATGGTINFANGEIILTEGVDDLAIAGGSLTVAATTTGYSSLVIPNGTVMTTISDGAIEADADVFYGATDAGNRGYIPVRHVVRADATNTLANSASEQALFTGANDTITLETGTYKFEALVHLNTMSATSGNAAYDPLGAGTATVGSWLWESFCVDGAAATAATWQGQYNTTQQTTASCATAGTNTNMAFKASGTFEVTGAGTMIPSVTLVTANAAVVAVGSYFMFERIGSTSMTSIGQWN